MDVVATDVKKGRVYWFRHTGVITGKDVYDRIRVEKNLDELKQAIATDLDGNETA